MEEKLNLRSSIEVMRVLIQDQACGGLSPSPTFVRREVPMRVSHSSSRPFPISPLALPDPSFASRALWPLCRTFAADALGAAVRLSGFPYATKDVSGSQDKITQSAGCYSDITRRTWPGTGGRCTRPFFISVGCIVTISVACSFSSGFKLLTDCAGVQDLYFSAGQ